MQVNFFETNFAIQTEHGLEIVRLHSRAGNLVKTFSKGIEIAGGDRKSGCHCVTAMADEEVSAFTECSGEIESSNASTGTAQLGSIATHDNRWAIELLENARCHYPNDADVPRALAFNDGEVRVRFEPALDHGEDLLDGAALELLAVGIARVQFPREAKGFIEVRCLQEMKRGLRCFQPTSSV
jgi:hypothetical protein